MFKLKLFLIKQIIKQLCTMGMYKDLNPLSDTDASKLTSQN